MNTKSELIFASGNLGKVGEITALCSDIPVTIKSLKDIWDPVPDIPETGVTFEENARLKAEWVYSRKQVFTIADDSGLEVDALGGAPGIYSSRYAGEQANDTKNIDKLLSNLVEVPQEKRTARFRCVICLLGPSGFERVVCGVCEGTILEKPVGDGGFGYDPLFVPLGFTESFAQLNPSVKNEISHRGKALLSLKEEIHACFK